LIPFCALSRIVVNKHTNTTVEKYLFILSALFIIIENAS
jgi:hypothetical protein